MKCTTHLTVLIAAAVLAGCGGTNPLFGGGSEYVDDGVFLYFINGVPAAGSMTIEGPSGRVASDLGFGERAAEIGECPEDATCVPVQVDRARGGIFDVKVDGQKARIDLTEELSAFYEQETGTVILGGGTHDDALRATVVRHTQTVSSGCALTMANALSGDPLPDHAATFEIAAELQVEPATAGYLDESTLPILTRCGELPTSAPLHASVARAELMNEIAADPWFVVGACKGGVDDCLHWGVDRLDGRAALDPDATFASAPRSGEYFDCLEEAVTVTADACPTELTWDDVEIDWLKVEDCREPVGTTASLTPTTTTTTWYGTSVCETSLRVRTPGQDYVFGPDEGDVLGNHQDGDLVVESIEIPQGSERIFTLFGRPVNPRTFAWNASETFVDLAHFPYPEGAEDEDAGDDHSGNNFTE